LEAASEASKVPVNVSWEPFLLNPNMPEEGEPIVDHLVKKYGPAAKQRFNDPNSSMKESGRAVGIEFTNNRRVLNTIRAHTLIEYVKKDLDKNEKANEIMENLYQRYFERGENINSVELLQEVARESGQVEVPAEVIEDTKRHDDVRARDLQVKRGGVHGVPFFIIEQNNGGQPVSFSGAYPPAFIAEQLIDASGSDDSNKE
jgi:predicted DsbA family dithiol-disulfide isomerase